LFAFAQILRTLQNDGRAGDHGSTRILPPAATYFGQAFCRIALASFLPCLFALFRAAFLHGRFRQPQLSTNTVRAHAAAACPASQPSHYALFLPLCSARRLLRPRLVALIPPARLHLLLQRLPATPRCILLPTAATFSFMLVGGEGPLTSVYKRPHTIPTTLTQRQQQPPVSPTLLIRVIPPTFNDYPDITGTRGIIWLDRSRLPSLLAIRQQPVPYTGAEPPTGALLVADDNALATYLFADRNSATIRIVHTCCPTSLTLTDVCQLAT